MAQITLNLDENTKSLLAQAAKTQEVSQSHWVADAIRYYAHSAWPKDCLALAGAFPDFPLREATPTLGEDLPRVEF